MKCCRWTRDRGKSICFGNTILLLFDFWEILLNISTWSVSYVCPICTTFIVYEKTTSWDYYKKVDELITLQHHFMWEPQYSHGFPCFKYTYIQCIHVQMSLCLKRVRPGVRHLFTLRHACWSLKISPMQHLIKYNYQMS